MELPESYFPTLARSAAELAVLLAVLFALHRLIRRFLSPERVARAFRVVLRTAVYVFVSAFVLDSFMTPWGFRDWVDRRGEFVANRLSIVVGHRPVLIGADLSGVSVHQVIPRPRTPAGQKQGR